VTSFPAEQALWLELPRRWGFTGPITRQDYLDFIHAPGDPQEPSAELESMLPRSLQRSQFRRK
jgi:hypothetical protein